MAAYNYRCPVHGDVFEMHHGMSERPAVVHCCGNPAERLLSNFYFQEDRLRFAGSGLSESLGGPKPQSRKERDLICKQKGVEPVDKMPSEWKQIVEYSEHVRTGGDRLTPKQEYEQLHPKPDFSNVPTIKQRMDKVGFKRGF